MKPRFFAALLAALMIFPLTGCKKSLLDKDDPVTLTFWHVYGEQSGSPWTSLWTSSTGRWARKRACG